ncbi:hypothetical protein [Nostoc sp. FACHB-280]|uniref:hypothetical protein n=1 Tax=Nostoc sp. FACHB-280 TaxID=2692839 RepID=UPI00168B5C27|nr:hypothetical protein [Nostoc sp. FACHB-280]MBD2498420.1 hypothetical protein [Nostoc sp. FACHB-280]
MQSSWGSAGIPASAIRCKVMLRKYLQMLDFTFMRSLCFFTVSYSRVIITI